MHVILEFGLLYWRIFQNQLNFELPLHIWFASKSLSVYYSAVMVIAKSVR